MKEKLIELFRAIAHENCFSSIYNISDYLIANGVTVQKWIPVTERLPENGKDVLVITSGSERNMAVWRFFHCNPNGHPHWEDEVGDGLILEAATHWMPLPEPPKGE